MRPLAGCVVLDFSTLLPGPMATLLLCEAGAEVVKIEKPRGGDDARSYQPKWGVDSVNFGLLNRGKKSIALDLKKPADRDALAPLLRRADVIVEQFRPGVMTRLGCDYDQVSRINRRVIYCSITGYGQSGPRAVEAGHDLNYIARTGLLALSMGETTHPVMPPALVADIAGGAYPAVMNILLALRERDLTGVGRYLDVSMTDNLFPFMYWALGNGLAAGEWPANGQELVTGGSPRYRLYATQDDKVVAAAPLEQKFWDTFCEVIGLEPQYRDDTTDSAATTRRVAEILASAPAHVWEKRFAAADCCCSVVAELRDVLNDPHVRAREVLKHVLVNRNGSLLPALPVPIDDAFRGDASEHLGAPDLGEHNLMEEWTR